MTFLRRIIQRVIRSIFTRENAWVLLVSVILLLLYLFWQSGQPHFVYQGF